MVNDTVFYGMSNSKNTLIVLQRRWVVLLQSRPVHRIELDRQNPAPPQQQKFGGA